MRKQKRICFRLTASRVYGGVIVVFSALNLAIVGMAFDISFSTATPTIASGLRGVFATATFLVPTSTEAETVATTLVPTDTFTSTSSATFTSTITNTATQTASFTPTVTFTHTPSVTPCFLQYTWPTYIVQSGDTLSHIARITDSTVKELMQANCMMDTLIFSGQRLYVPRLPIATPTVTPTTQMSFCIDFEDLVPRTAYVSGDTFVSMRVRITVSPFAWSNGQMTRDGIAYVTTAYKAGGFGNEIQVNNVNLDFNFVSSLKSLSILFGEYGGNLNISINGDFLNFANFADINGSVIGGVKVSGLNGFGNDQGFLQLSGTVKSFSIGGQELWIDNVCQQVNDK
jgi:LysM repeat protein